MLLFKGQRRYCACLTFLEPYRKPKKSKASPKKHQQQNGHNNNNNSATGSESDSYVEAEYFDEEHHSLPSPSKLTKIKKKYHPSSSRILPITPCKLYVAKSLVLISRLEYIDLFRSCLSLIYAVYVDKRHSPDRPLLETIVANLLSIQVNAPGTALSNTFSLGADDRHLLQATASLSVPVTGSAVFSLFREIGIANGVKLVCAIMADFKVLFFSRSYMKLYDACRAIEALIFPLKYTGVFVPVLPCFGSFLEFPAAPTPYIIGVHSSFRRLIEEMHADCLQECVKVDLDGACVQVPQCVDSLICGGAGGGSGLGTTSTGSVDCNTTSSNFGDGFNSGREGGERAARSRFGLPHYLYESTVNFLFAILKPDVLRGDELGEFCRAGMPAKGALATAASETSKVRRSDHKCSVRI